MKKPTENNINNNHTLFHSQYDFWIDPADVKGQENIKRALEIAAAGGHNAILIGAARCRWDDAGERTTAYHFFLHLPLAGTDTQDPSRFAGQVAGKCHTDFETSLSVSPPHALFLDVALVGGGGILATGETSKASL